VGICHPSWIDTDIVRNAERDLPTFRATREKLPWPANGTTSVETCVALILRGLARRKARVYVPGNVLVSNWTKSLVNSPLAWPVLRKMAARAVPSMEREVDALGRFHHAHVPETEAVD
jgi:hypothetical protein